jgi:exosome complex component MTR3
MADRRRINGPIGATLPPIYLEDGATWVKKKGVERSRPSNSIRKICEFNKSFKARPVLTSSTVLQTGVTPSASGSAYLELEHGAVPGSSGLKLSCTVHGPRALPKSTPFSPHVILTTHVKYAPFATRQRRGYLRDTSERDIAAHLETALRGVIIADRWPKSGVDIIISVIEGDQDRGAPQSLQDEAWSMMNVLSSCITVAAAAMADAGIDCVDTVAGGVAAMVHDEATGSKLMVDPIMSEHDRISSACCVAYLPTREEITNLWFKGDMASSEEGQYTEMVEAAIYGSRQANQVVVAALRETAQRSHGGE